MRTVMISWVAAVVAVAASFWAVTPVWADLGDDLINELRCPSATYSQPLATSETRDALWMRTFIRAKVAEGWPRQRIVDTLVRQYGDGILPVPAKEGFGLAAWITPFATIFGGGIIMSCVLAGWLRERRWRDAYLDAEMARDIDGSDLRRYEAQLTRELQQFE